jgi:hypothetical protein
MVSPTEEETVSFLLKINGYLYYQRPEGFSTLEKNALICYQWAVWHPFYLNLNFLGRV